ncbi:MAG: hypothetical protein N3B10_01530 [Armatimonadetes bacterium]|nr:hypothetical protein [Armatimonadota bacterium]MCX7967148.1 hypothetical protein [Armatimonadota bacterium]MDW8141952.1 hypothetical protein [Armatimonadota bacterium]
MRRKVFLFLTVLLALHFTASVAYLFRFPAWRAPDEGAHFAYIQHLHQTGRLPIFLGKYEGTYEAHQPPLYYLTALPFVFPSLKGDKQNLTALYLARFASTLWGAFVVVAAFLLTLRLRNNEQTAIPIALLSGAFAALLPVHLLVCASAGNDSTAGATSAMALLWLCHICLLGQERTERQRLLDAAIAGILSGMSLLAKSSNIVLLPLSLIAVALKSVRENQPSDFSASDKKKRKVSKQPAQKSAQTRSPFPALPFLLPPAIALFTFAFTAGWWLWRNATLYGDPLAIQAFLEGFKDSPKPSDFLEPEGRYAKYGAMPLTTYIMWVAQITLFTWLGIYGEPNEAVKGLARLFEGAEPNWGWVLIATLIGIFALVAIALGCIESCRSCVNALKQKQWHVALAHALPFVLLLLVFAEFVQFNRHFFQAQARYFYPAHAATAHLFAIGIFRVVPKKGEWHATLIGATLLASLAWLVWWKWAAL